MIAVYAAYAYLSDMMHLDANAIGCNDYLMCKHIPLDANITGRNVIR